MINFNIKKLMDIIEADTGIAYAYHSFNAARKKLIPPPYITYVFTGSNNIKADNKIYFPVSSHTIELYTDIKDENIEQKIENIFNLNSVIWEKNEVFIDDQSVFQINYDINI